MSSTTDYINKPNAHFVEFCARNMVSEFRSSPGMDMKALICILSIKYGVNPNAGAFSASVAEQRSNNFAHNGPTSHTPRQAPYNQSFDDSRRGRATTPSRGSRDSDRGNEGRGQSISRWDNESRSDASSQNDRFAIRPKGNKKQVRENNLPDERRGRSSTPAPSSRDGGKRSESRPRERSVSRSGRKDFESREPIKDSSTPSTSVKDLGMKSFAIDQFPIIKSQLPNLTDAQYGAEIKHRWGYMSESEKTVFAEKDVALEKERLSNLDAAKAAKAAIKAAEKDGFRMYSNSVYTSIRNENPDFDHFKTKNAIMKGWKALDTSTKEVFSLKQKSDDARVDSIVTEKLRTKVWPELSTETVQSLKCVRNGQLYLSTFDYSNVVTPAIKLQIWNLDYYIQAILEVGRGGYLIVNGQKGAQFVSLDDLISAVKVQTSIDISKEGTLMRNEARMAFVNFLKSPTTSAFGYTAPQLKQDNTATTPVPEMQPAAIVNPPAPFPSGFPLPIPSMSTHVTTFNVENQSGMV